MGNTGYVFKGLVLGISICLCTPAPTYAFFSSSSNVVELKRAGSTIITFEADNTATVDGILSPLDSSSTCNASLTGYMRYNPSNEEVEVCTGSVWKGQYDNPTSPAGNPDPFSFPDSNGQRPGDYAYSDVITLTGFSGSLEIKASGPLNSSNISFSVNGSAFVNSATIRAGETLQVKAPISATAGETYNYFIQVGTSFAQWNVTTRSGTGVFYTSSSYNGNLGGLAGADEICQTEAINNGHIGKWRALLSDSTESVASRFPSIIYPVVRASGGQIMDSSNIFDGSLDGVILGGYFDVWTGSNANGTSNANNCNNWTADDSPASGQYGQTDEVDDDWINYSDRYCDTLMKFMCMQE